MEWTVNVAVDRSAFPERTRARIIEGLRRKEVDAALLYSGWRQTGRWIALHAAHSPAQTLDAVKDVYARAFEAAAQASTVNVLHVVSLGCGDASKDVACIARLREMGKTAIYSPCDISLDMVLTAQRNAGTASRGLQSTPLLFDLLECSTLPGILKSFDPSGAARVVLFLGSLHNFDAPAALQSILYSVRSQDLLVISANLAPETNYHAALEAILPQYDNALTRAWLGGALLELELDQSDGSLEFTVEESPQSHGLKQIEANFVFSRRRTIHFAGEEVQFLPQERLRVFRSTRFTRGRLRAYCENAGLRIEQEFVAASEEEAVYLCRRTSRPGA